MITFNPDPKLQAKEMISELIQFVEANGNLIGNAKSCALISANMCYELSSDFPRKFYMSNDYWEAVIKELEKL